MAADEEKLSEIYGRLGQIGAASAEARAAIILSGLGFSTEVQVRDKTGGTRYTAVWCRRWWYGIAVCYVVECNGPRKNGGRGLVWGSSSVLFFLVIDDVHAQPWIAKGKRREVTISLVKSNASWANNFTSDSPRQAVR